MYKVIVAITTYNLENYIAEALDSVICQKTNFKFKIRVADDCSTDETPTILKEYAEKYPDIVEVLYSERNLGSLANSNRLFDRIDCEYFSFLDGDDYWVNDTYLQKFVDFLDSHPEYSMCAGNTRYLREGKLAENVIEESKLNKTYNRDNLVSRTLPFVHTSAIVVRNSIFKNGLPKVFKDVVGTYEECACRGEDFRRILHLTTGSIFLYNDLVSVYRIHNQGMWQGSSYLKRMLETAISYHFYSKYFENEYGDLYKDMAYISYKHLFKCFVISLLKNNMKLYSKEKWRLHDFINGVNHSKDKSNYKFKYAVINFLFGYLVKFL